MSLTKKLGYSVWGALMVGVLVVSPQSSANNFKEASEKKGCASLLTSSKQSECRSVQDRKDELCNRITECDDDKQGKDITELQNRLQTLRDNKLNDSDKETFKSKTRDLWNKIDARYQASDPGIRVAKECIAQRAAVQEWFERTAIPFTHEQKDKAIAERKTIVEKYNDATKKRDEAKKRLDDKPSDEGLRREVERAKEEMAEAEKKIQEFDRTFGPNVQQHAERLVSHYREEKTNHSKPTLEADNRLRNCEAVRRMSYPSLPF